MRIVMMGTGRFAVPTFRDLMESEHDVVALFTRPPHGHRKKTPPNPMAEAAKEYQIRVEMPDSVNAPSSLQVLRELDPDLLVVCDYGQILSSDALRSARLGGINLHGSILPKYRGAAPINWALYYGETEVGVTVIHMTPKLDAGPCLSVDKIAVSDDDDAITIETKLAELGIDTVRRAIEMLSKWDGVQPIGWPQDPNLATKAPRLRKQDGQIDWNRTAHQIANQVRAFKPWPGSFTDWLRRDKPPLRILVELAQPSDEAIKTDSSISPGQVVKASSGEIHVRCGEGIVRIDALKPSGKRTMNADEFLRGYALRPGDRFGAE